jgi:hypothetical protein
MPPSGGVAGPIHPMPALRRLVSSSPRAGAERELGTLNPAPSPRSHRPPRGRLSRPQVIPAENLVAAFQQGSAKLIGAAASADDARVMLEGEGPCVGSNCIQGAVGPGNCCRWHTDGANPPLAHVKPTAACLPRVVRRTHDLWPLQRWRSGRRVCCCGLRTQQRWVLGKVRHLLLHLGPS